MRSPGRSERKSAATPDPARTCSRDVRGSATPYFANTYFVNPEQSNPSPGVLPPHTYLTPRYESAVRSTRLAAAHGGGDSGMRRRDAGARPELVVVVLADGRFAMTVARTVSGDTPRLAGAQPVTARTDTAAIAPTRASEGVIMARRDGRIDAVAIAEGKAIIPQSVS